MLAAVVAAVLGNLTAERWTAGVQAVCQAARQGKPDVGAAAITTLLRHRPRAGGVSVPVPSEVKAFAPVLTAAGLL